MESVIITLEQDEYLCNVVKTKAAYRWLSDSKYREELRETSIEAIEERKKVEEKEKKRLKAPSQILQELSSRMIIIEDGTFMMGDGLDNDNPVHEVELGRFEISPMQVTQAVYETIMGVNPSYFKGANNPVENVSWHDANVFCERLSKATGRKYMLPTEAQWEYACRAGTETKYNTGDNESDIAEAGWYKDNSNGTTHPIGQKKPNAWKLYDMHGNVWEWCNDWYDDYPNGKATNPTGHDTGLGRVVRGGGWNSGAGDCRSASRGKGGPSLGSDVLGFRVVRRLYRQRIHRSKRILPAGVPCPLSTRFVFVIGI